MHSLQGHHPEHRRGGLHDGRRRHAGRPLQRGKARSPHESFRCCHSPPLPPNQGFLSAAAVSTLGSKIILQNTGTSSCHSPFLELLLFLWRVCCCCLVPQSCPALLQPHVACQAPSPRGFPDPGTEPMSPALAGRCFTTEAPKEGPEGV